MGDSATGSGPAPAAGSLAPPPLPSGWKQSLESNPLLKSAPERLTWHDYFNHFQFSRAYAVFYSIMAVLGIFLVLSTFYVSYPHPTWFVALEGAVTASFSLEILIQLAAQGTRFFSSWWGYAEIVMLVMCLLGYIEELAVQYPSLMALSRRYHLGDAPVYDLLDECILLLRYGAQAGRVFVFMRKQPVNDTLDLGSLDLKAVQLYLDPAAAEWGQGLVPEDDGTLKPSFSAPSERSFDSYLDQM
eukprot:EG_transcript_17430